MEEIWRDAPGFENYSVSNLGNIKNNKTGRQLKPKPKKNGYILLELCKKYVFLHRLIAFAFPEICGEWFEGAQVDHKNRVRTDNRAENLHWVSQEGNSNNPNTLAYVSESRKWIPKSEEFKKKVSETMTNNTYNCKWVIKLSKNNEILHFYPSTAEAARANNLYQANISACCLGKHKTTGGFIWKYAE